MYYLNPTIENLVRIFDQNERKDYLRLDLNENPGGLPQEFIDKVLEGITPQFVAQYPETLHFSEVFLFPFQKTQQCLFLPSSVLA